MSGTNGRRSRTALLFALSGVVLFSTACNEWGLPNKNRPFADAAQKEFRYPVYETSPASSKLLQVAGHTWQVSGATEAIPANMLTPVADVNGQQVFSLKSDTEPYNVLYTAGENGRYSIVSNIN
jgi:hypothetical protein